jgi:protein SOK2
MHLKGVWIPFERALDFANKEKITDQLYPLFVHNIGSLLYNPESISRSSQAVAATERRRMDSTDPGRSSQAPQPAPLHHHHSMQSTVGSQPQHSIAPHPDQGRPSIGRAHTFPNVPTPPTSASSVMGMGNPGSSYWDGQNMANNVASTQPLSIDTGLSNNNARSMPTTPATTPPGSSMQPYQNQQNYDQKPYPSYPSASQNGYAPQPRMNTYPQDASFKSEMGPPSAPGAVPTESEHHDGKADVYNHVNGTSEAVHHEQGYADPNASAYGANRGHYAYNPSATHQHVSPEMTSSPSHQTNSGRGTPRTMPGQQQWPPDYQTPPRSAPTSSVYSVMGDSRSSNSGSGEYTASSYSASSQPATSNKRGREDDDHDRPASRDLDYKRQKNYGAPMGSANHMQAIATGGGMPRQR